MLPDFKNARIVIERLQNEFLGEAMKRFMGPFFGNIPKRKLHEGDQLHHEYDKGVSHDTPLKSVGTNFSYTTDEIIENPNIITERMLAAMKDLAQKQTVAMIKELGGIIESVGNVVQPSTGQFSPKDLLNAYRLIEIPFDKAGKPMLPNIVGAPDTSERITSAFKEMIDNTEYRNQFEQIIAEKRKIWDDRQNNRKLVD